jgi:hypothetical protein
MKKFESITFQVESDLKKPQIYLREKYISWIFDELFKVGKYKKSQKDGRDIVQKVDEPLEILHYTLDTDKELFFNYKKSSLIQGLVSAYKNHYPITVTPDMIWILVLQGFSRFMEKYAETVRDNFVNFQGKIDLNVLRLELTPYTATKKDWDGIMKEFVEKIGQNVGQDTIDNLECNFSSTTQVAQVTSHVSIMSGMKQYFNFKLYMAGCGISSITLEGSIQDWEKIKSKLEFLSTKGLEWYTRHLIPIINNIIESKKYYSRNGRINQELIEFWKGMIRVKGKGENYDPHIINGWIVKFIPNLSEENPKIYEEISETQVPDQIIACPMQLTWIISTKKKIDYKCSLFSGFYGMVQDEETFNVRPVIGYAIVVDEKTESNITDEERNKIIEELKEKE